MLNSCSAAKGRTARPEAVALQRASRLQELGLQRSVARYHPIRSRPVNWAGDSRSWLLLLREAFGVNHKRVYRLYRDEGLGSPPEEAQADGKRRSRSNSRFALPVYQSRHPQCDSVSLTRSGRYPSTLNSTVTAPS